MKQHFPQQDGEYLIPLGFCRGCDLPLTLNDLGFCDYCYAKLERDLIRMRDWEYSAQAFGVPDEKLEALRDRIIHKYGAANELLVIPKPKPKNKRSHSTNTKCKPAIAVAIREYTTEDVLQVAQDFIQKQDDEWVNFSRVSQHLYERFYKLKPKWLGQVGKRYNSILKVIADYPDRFQIRAEPDRGGVVWVRVTP